MGKRNQSISTLVGNYFQVKTGTVVHNISVTVQYLSLSLVPEAHFVSLSLIIGSTYSAFSRTQQPLKLQRVFC